MDKFLISGPVLGVSNKVIIEACIGVLGIPDICNFTLLSILGCCVQYFLYFH